MHRPLCAKKRLDLGRVPEVTPRVVEIDDYSGAGDGTDLHTKIGRDGDGLADDDQKLFRTSDGTWYGDTDLDGRSEAVAFVLDQDGRLESAATTGQGESLDTVGAEQVAAESADIVDGQPADDLCDARTATTSVTASAAPDDDPPTDSD